MTAGLPLSVRLALADLAHARVSTLCQVVGLASLLVPLLIIFGIKNGVIADRTASVLSNPENLRITIQGQNLYSADFIERWGASARVGFMSPQPLNLALQPDFAEPFDGGAIVPKVVVFATGEGDPYLGDWPAPPKPGQVVLTAATAGGLGGVGPGAEIQAIYDGRDGAPLGAFMTFEVIHVIPAALWGRAGALMAPEDAFLLAAWKDGLVSDENLDALREGYRMPTTFPLIRLYAASVEAAIALVEELAAEGFSSSAALEKARDLLKLRDALNTGFLTVAIVGLFGVTATFGASLWAAINRNRRPLSLLRLGGLSRRATLLLPVVQAFAVGLLGWILALVAYFALGGALDLLLADTFGVTGSIARVSGAEIAMSGIATLVVSILSALFAAASTTSITPEEGFLDGR